MDLSIDYSIPRPRAERGHLKSLDGIRGLAILMVFASHAFQANAAAGSALVRAVDTLLFYGMFGVDLFFVLSGFLITGILLDTRSGQNYFRAFYARRILRIFPLYYGVLLLLFALTPFLHLKWNGMGWLMLFDLQNLRPAQIDTFMPSASIGLYHFWSLAVEEQFYCVWPFVVFAIQDRRTLLFLTYFASAAALLLRLALILSGSHVLAIHVTPSAARTRSCSVRRSPSSTGPAIGNTSCALPPSEPSSAPLSWSPLFSSMAAIQASPRASPTPELFGSRASATPSSRSPSPASSPGPSNPPRSPPACSTTRCSASSASTATASTSCTLSC